MVEASSDVGFGALGLEVTGVEEVRGEVVVRAQTPGGGRVFCAGCGVRARAKGRRPVVLRDAEVAGSVPVRVLWNKRIWACPNSGCEAKTWTEQSGLAGPRRVLTRRAGEWAAGRLGDIEGSVASLARRLGVGWQTLWMAVAPIAQQAVGDPERVAAAARVGFDETVMTSATRGPRRRFVSAAVDAGTGQIMDVFDGRDAADLEQWAHQQPDGLTAAVEVVCLDPHEGYRKAVGRLKSKGVLGSNVKVAADPFHIVRLANRALDDCRSRTQNDTTGHRGRKGDPLYGARKLLSTGSERLDPQGWEKMSRALDAGDPYDEVADCWAAKEKIRSVFKCPVSRFLRQVVVWC